jgi:uncharacterized protein YciI
MLFVVLTTDKPGGLALRMATRPTHLEYLRANIARLIQAGPHLTEDAKPAGTLLVIEAKDRQDAENFVANDPYSKAGLFDSVTIRPYRAVFKDGAELV